MALLLAKIRLIAYALTLKKFIHGRLKNVNVHMIHLSKKLMALAFLAKDISMRKLENAPNALLVQTRPITASPDNASAL